MYSKPKTAAEKRFHSQLCEWARYSPWLADTFGLECVPYAFELHHIKGAQYKLKIDGVTTKVGELLVLPVPRLYHSVSTPQAENHPLNVTRRKKAFEARFGSQFDLWRDMLAAYVIEGYELPAEITSEMIEAVMG